jgi:hypothetical protein
VLVGLVSRHDDFEIVMRSNLHVKVYHQGKLLDLGGVIEEHDDVVVKIRGNYFLKETCRFIVMDL